MRSASLDELVAGASVIVTTGSGGVGKTTVAAAIGVGAARAGRKVVVVTIDPAQRLMDALGLEPGSDASVRPRGSERGGGLAGRAHPHLVGGPDGTGSDPSATGLGGRRAGEVHPIPGDWDGELAAVMLDAKGTFDRLIESGASSPDQIARILSNPIYKSVSGALSGTQEYMAAEKLHELATDERWDLVVVDTPPSRNALDFLTAPDRLLAFFDHPLYRVLSAPSRGVFKVAGAAAQTVLKVVSRLVGSELVDDVFEFFAAVDGLEPGFRRRATEARQILLADRTAFVLVAGASRDTAAEARHFAERLTGLGIEISSLVVNLMTPATGVESSVARALHAECPEGSDLAHLASNLAELSEQVELEAVHVAALTAGLGTPSASIRPVMIPRLEREVDDIEGLIQVAGRLFAEAE